LAAEDQYFWPDVHYFHAVDDQQRIIRRVRVKHSKTNDVQCSDDNDGFIPYTRNKKKLRKKLTVSSQTGIIFCFVRHIRSYPDQDW